MDPSLWGCLHDGLLVQAAGDIPGELTLRIECSYVRDMFPGAGDSFLVTLHGCSFFEYQPHDEAAIQDLEAIARLELEILSASARDPLEVSCSDGTLRLRYETAQVALDSGHNISLVQLDEAAERYWRQWEQRHKADS